MAKSPSCPEASGIAVAHTGGCGTSSVGVAGPNGWLGTRAFHRCILQLQQLDTPIHQLVAVLEH